MPQAVLLVTLWAVALTGLLISVAEARQWAGDVSAGVQRFHRHWVTRLGGVAVFAVLASWLLFGPLDLAAGAALLWLACLAPAFCVGLAEDLTGRVSARARLALTLGGAALAWLLLDVRVERLGVGALDAALAHTPLLSLALSVLLVGGMAHAVNIVDGCNGLAGSFALLALLAIAYVAGSVGDAPLAGIALGAAGATAGFLYWNFPRGRVFLGDGGAYLLGTVIAFLAVKLVRDHTQVPPVFAALLLAYPAWETLFSIYRKRVLRGRSPLEPDGAHLHMLLYKRLARTCRREASAAERVLRNSVTTLYAAPLLIGPALAAALWWDDALALVAGVAALVVAYVAAYRALVGLRVPAGARLSAVAGTWLANKASSLPTARSIGNLQAIRLRPAPASRARSGASRSTVSMAQVSAAVSPTGTSRPAPPASSSGTPPAAVAITGTPAAIASISATGMPSRVLARTTPSTMPRR
jgi:UDP-GlcNAc:undecaprenyl-phosphate/decaprenyl-phosphate GlcNAc-1-phosphate transferase